MKWNTKFTQEDKEKSQVQLENNQQKEVVRPYDF